MISRNSNGGFFAQHWDWLVAGFGVVVLAAGGALFALSGGVDPEENAADAVRELMAAEKSETGVKSVDMTDYDRALQLATKPPVVAEVDATAGNFLVSAGRIFCAGCQKPIPAGSTKCPLCGAEQEAPKKVVLDGDGDGLPDEWEVKYGLDPKAADADDDKDQDGFTNAEELEAKTDPSDKASHPDYLDSLKLTLPLRETKLPFYFTGTMKTPSGLKFQFKDPSRAKEYDRGNYSLLADQEIGKSGFAPVEFVEKSEKRKMGGGMEKKVDVSEAVVVRKADGKKVAMTINRKGVPVDVQATLTFDRGPTREFVVVPGATFSIFGTKYKVVDIKSVGKGASVSIETVPGKIRKVDALEQ